MRQVLTYLVMLALLVLGSNVLVGHMGAQVPGLKAASATCPAAVPVTTTGPTVVASTGGISPLPGQVVRVMATAIIQWATGTSAAQVKIVRGVSASGTALVTPTTVSPTAGSTLPLSYGAEDSPAESVGLQYSLVISPTGAAAAGSVTSCEIWDQAF